MVAVLAILSTWPLMVLVGLGIKLSSRGPVLFCPPRVGRNGDVFSLLKFRSMYFDNRGSVIASRDDKRIFPFGRVIRLLKLDELPQFFNVLIGDMSIVGPRPEAPEIVEKYYSLWMRESLDVRPGITSPGSIYYYVNEEKLLSFGNAETRYVEDILPTKLQIDIEYIRCASIFSDLKVIVKTCRAIFGSFIHDSQMRRN